MSYVSKKGKTTAWRNMVIRQQVSDFISDGKIITTLTKAKESQRHIEKLITLGKENTLAHSRKIDSIILDTKKHTKSDLLKKVYELGKKYLKRQGGYTRVLKLGTRPSDRTEMAIIELV